MDERVEWDCTLEDGNDVIAVAISESGRLHLVCAECVAEIIADDCQVWEGPTEGGRKVKITFRGTHVLSRATRVRLFGEDA